MAKASLLGSSRWMRCFILPPMRASRSSGAYHAVRLRDAPSRAAGALSADISAAYVSCRAADHAGGRKSLDLAGQRHQPRLLDSFGVARRGGDARLHDIGRTPGGDAVSVGMVR